jgi:hypothetical protein
LFVDGVFIQKKMTETLHHALRAMMQFPVFFFGWIHTSIHKQKNKFIPKFMKFISIVSWIWNFDVRILSIYGNYKGEINSSFNCKNSSVSWGFVHWIRSRKKIMRDTRQFRRLHLQLRPPSHFEIPGSAITKYYDDLKKTNKQTKNISTTDGCSQNCI